MTNEEESPKSNSEAAGRREFTLLACPCGETPKTLCIEDGHTCKYAIASGDCCNGWRVEFRTEYIPLDSITAMRLAVLVWNAMKRGTPKQTRKVIANETIREIIENAHMNGQTTISGNAERAYAKEYCDRLFNAG